MTYLLLMLYVRKRRRARLDSWSSAFRLAYSSGRRSMRASLFARFSRPRMASPVSRAMRSRSATERVTCSRRSLIAASAPSALSWWILPLALSISMSLEATASSFRESSASKLDRLDRLDRLATRDRQSDRATVLRGSERLGAYKAVQSCTKLYTLIEFI